MYFGEWALGLTSIAPCPLKQSCEWDADSTPGDALPLLLHSSCHGNFRSVIMLGIQDAPQSLWESSSPSGFIGCH